MPDNDPPYSNRELDMKFENLQNNLSDKIEFNHQETTEAINVLDRRNTDKQTEMLNFLGEIKIQTTATNGKVRKLEKIQAGIYMAGAVAFVMGGIIISLAVYIYNIQVNRITNLKNQVQLLQSK